MEFASGITVSVLDRLASYAVHEVRQAWGAKLELQKLKRTLLDIKDIVQDAEEKQVKDSTISRWIGDLKDVCNDAEDVLDEFEFRHLRRRVLYDDQPRVKGEVRHFFSRRWNPVVFNFRMSHKLKHIRERLVQIYDNGITKFSLKKLVQQAEGCPAPMNPIRETDSILVGDVIGRDVDKQTLMDLFGDTISSSSTVENVSVISIFGLGGLGKTTLAKSVFNDVKAKNIFTFHMWVCVSENFDIQTLGRGIIAATKQHCDGGSLDLMKTGLQDILRDKKFLLVLDDVWEIKSTGITAEKWKELKAVLDVGAEGSKIIVTTRDESVASLVRPIHKHCLGPLSGEDPMTLFKRHAFNNEYGQHNKRLINIGEDIVGKCGGVPLALATLGGMLKSKGEDYWSFVRDELLNVSDGDNPVMAALKLSYNALPPHLKPCFAFCSLYPKDHPFPSDEIVSLWMAQGFLKSSRKNEDINEIGLDYIRQFCYKSLFQVELDMKTNIIFKIHDLVHDLAISMAQTEYYTVNHRPVSAFEKIRYVSTSANDVSEDDTPAKEFFLQFEKLRTILIVDSDAGITNQSVLESCISRFRYMRALHIKGSTLEEVPSSIGNLIHLRYLNLADNTEIKRFPTSICKLLNLQFLSLQGCKALEELPKGIGNLINLKSLDITTQQVELPKGLFRRLSLLQFLSIRGCKNLKSLGEEIEYLTNLRQLLISECEDLESLPANMKNLTALHTLVIGDCQNIELVRSGQGISGLRSFILNKSDLEALPIWLQDSADTLESLVIANLKNLKELPEWLQNLTSLESLLIGDLKNLKELPEWLQNLTSLESLNIGNCPELSALPQGMHRLTALKELRIIRCPVLRKRCKKETGEDWSKIKHVPKIKLYDSDDDD